MCENNYPGRDFGLAEWINLPIGISIDDEIVRLSQKSITENNFVSAQKQDFEVRIAILFSRTPLQKIGSASSSFLGTLILKENPFPVVSISLGWSLELTKDPVQKLLRTPIFLQADDVNAYLAL